MIDNYKEVPPISLAFAARFWQRVVKGEGCWLWTGNLSSTGYGRFYFYTPGKLLNFYAHRVSWALAHGRTPGRGEVIRHSCDNPPCVNPAHLRAGSPADNIADMVARNRHPNSQKTHCPSGHPYSPENTIVEYSSGPCGVVTKRKCRTCVRNREKAKRHAA